MGPTEVGGPRCKCAGAGFTGFGSGGDVVGGVLGIVVFGGGLGDGGALPTGLWDTGTSLNMTLLLAAPLVCLAVFPIGIVAVFPIGIVLTS